MIGHNGGPTLEPGHSWRSYQWRKAKKKLMPNTIPLTIVKMRLRRAAELGMDYKTYAALRQASGRDICGLLFSSNALEIYAGQSAMPKDRRDKVAAVEAAQRLAAVQAPSDPARVLDANPLDATVKAPSLIHSWSETRRQLVSFLGDRRLSGGQVVLIGETALEEEWAAAARAAGYLTSQTYFETGHRAE